MEFEMRKSTDKDYEQIKALLKESFGDMAEHCGALDWVDNRYMVAVVNNQIVACTGILPLHKSDFNGYEITWTCTTKEFRHNGLIVKMLDACERELKDSKPIYCSCWHLTNKDKANLHNALTRLGFEEVIHSHVVRVHPHIDMCNYCCYSSAGCKCTGDLYQKNRA